MPSPRPSNNPQNLFRFVKQRLCCFHVLARVKPKLAGERKEPIRARTVAINFHCQVTELFEKAIFLSVIKPRFLNDRSYLINMLVNCFLLVAIENRISRRRCSRGLKYLLGLLFYNPF